MAFCVKCGAAVDDRAPFCSACGASQTPASAPAGSVAAPGAPVPREQMSENVAGLLCYLIGWVTGIVFLLIDKRPFVRFHAAQSIVVFGGLQILSIVVSLITGVGIFAGVHGMSFGWGMNSLIGLLELVLWIVLMIKAYQGERFRVPIAADIAEQLFGKS
jgi:uncharacterized membrane protein